MCEADWKLLRSSRQLSLVQGLNLYEHRCEEPVRSFPRSRYSGPRFARRSNSRSTKSAKEEPALALRYYFDLVCPYSYILGFEVERAEDDGLAEVDWLPFEFRPAPKQLPEPRSLHPRPLARPHLRSRRHARGRDTRPALLTSLDAGPGATLVRRGRGAG